jgi:ABC-type antimicrobial peptide transport system permease subunit
MLSLAYFTFKDLVHDRWRSLLTILSLAVLVAGYLLLVSQAQAFVILISQSRVTSNLIIIAADTIDPMDSSLDEGVLQTAQQIAPGQIRKAFPTLFRHLNIDGRLMQVRAAPLEEMSTAMDITLLQGRWPYDSRQIVISQAAAQLTSWKIGSTVRIYGTDFQVTGLVRTGENTFGSLWMTYAEGQRLFGTSHGFQVGYLSLEPWADPESVRLKLQADPRISTASTVYLETAYSEGFNQANNNLLILSIILALVSLMALSFSTYTATSLSLTERSLEVGLLRVVGFTQGKLRSFLFARALVLTLAAYSLGWVVSLLFINYQRLHTSFDLLFMILKLTPASSLVGLGLAIVFAFLGVWLTSGRIAALTPFSRVQ